MITWQDPVALALAALLFMLSLWWRRSLVKRGEAPHCTQCTAGELAQAPAKPTRVDVSQLRLSRRR
jgi:hypothetical protein